jgi:L-lactate dehydrogenase complex protein LldG
MNGSPSKENILKKIRKALTNSTPIPFPQSDGNVTMFPNPQQELEIEFAEQFTKLQGKFIFCLNHQELAFQFNSLVKKQGWKKIYCKDKNLAGSDRHAGIGISH